MSDRTQQKKPLVSVVVPVYERPAFIVHCLESVMSQTFHDYEVIVVDDGSKDNTAHVIQKKFPQVKYLHQENRGVSTARNLAVKNSRGRFIALLDSDDLWKKNKLEEQIAFMLKHPDCLISHTDEVWLRNGKHFNQKAKHKKSGSNLFERSLQLCLISPSAVIMKREFFDIVGFFDETLPLCEDYDLWLRTTCRFEAGYINKKLTVKRGGHPDQLSSNMGLDKYRILSLAKLLESGILTKVQSDTAAAVLKTKCRIYANGCLKHGRTEEFETFSRVPDTVKTQYLPDLPDSLT